jgi:hypothetical protein
VRFVILHHTEVEAEHFDLMVHLPGEKKLVTWRILTAPETWGGRAPVAERIADHRADYLEYEGEISGGRGKVRRMAAGQAMLAFLPAQCVLRLGAGCEVALPLGRET